MLNHNEEFPHYVRTAGKITVLTACVGIFAFFVAFLIDVGSQELSKVSAQTATTTLRVLNTPPEFDINAFEDPDSSTTSPTNSGETQSWRAVGTDSNGAPYFLLVCSQNATPTPSAAAGPGSLGTAPPECATGAIQWGVSAATPSGDESVVSTTTTEAAPFAEVNDWYAWVCDDDPVNPRCNNVAVQGPTSTAASSSPFHVNSRPVLDNAYNDGPVDPGDTLTFLSTSSDPDTVGGADDLFIVVCSSDANYDSLTNTCSDFIASSTVGATQDVTTNYSVAIPTRDQTYSAFTYIYDEHGHQAITNPIQNNFDVNNVAPVVLGGDITLNGGVDLSLTVPAGETPSSTLDFTISDANSCLTAASSSEIVDYTVSVFRSGVGTSTCDGSAGSYNPNNCYPSGVATTTWNLECNATTSCASPLQDSIEYSCEFPLWFVADPTDAGPETPAVLAAQDWTAAVAGIDDDGLEGQLSTTSSPVDLLSFSSIDIVANEIAYGGVEPGDNTALTATSVAQNVGNTGLDQETRGESMCGTFSATNTCPVDPTSTIPADQQRFATTSASYTYPLALTLSSTTNQELELNVKKSTSTTVFQTATTYWGIAVPSDITLAGDYRGLNTYTAVTAEAADW